MTSRLRHLRLAALLLLGTTLPAHAGQAPFAASAPDIPISGWDRFDTSEQFSNTVSVIDPAAGTLLGVIRLGDPTPGNLSPLYRGQLLMHGMGFLPNRKTLAVISIGSNSVSFIDTATNAVRHVAYVGRSPHEGFFTPDGREVWVSVRGEDYIAVLDGTTYQEKSRIKVPNGPGMVIFSPDGKLGYVASSFSPETVVISVADHSVVGRVEQESPFSPDIAATLDGKQVWLTLMDVGRTMVFNATAPFEMLRVLDTGPITNHVNFARTAQGQFAYVTVGGLNQVKVFRTDDFSQVAAIEVGALPHGLWPSGDGTRMVVGLENADGAAVIDTGPKRSSRPSPSLRGGRAWPTCQVRCREGQARRTCSRWAWRPTRRASPLGCQTARPPRRSRCSTRGWCGCCKPARPGLSRASPMCWRSPARRPAAARCSRWRRS